MPKHASPPRPASRVARRAALGVVPVVLGLTLVPLAPLGCQTQDPTSSVAIPEVPDSAPLARMTAQQYDNTVRDLFAPVRLNRAPFPRPIEGPGGFENNAAFATPSTVDVEAHQAVAVKVSQALVAEGGLRQLLGCEWGDPICGRDYLVALGERAWRRPLTAAEAEQIRSDFASWVGQYGFDTAMELSLQSILQSPDFLYFPRFGIETARQGDSVPLDDWEVAARLSYFLWNSMPDDQLFAAAREGKLRERKEVIKQAWRLLGDWRAREGVVDFHRQLLDFDDVGAQGVDLAYYADLYAQEGFSLFDEPEDDQGLSDHYYLEYIPELRYEADVFVSQHVFEVSGRLEDLLTSTKVWTTPAVARIAYGQDVDEDRAKAVEWYIDETALSGLGLQGADGEEFVRTYYETKLDPATRAGLFSLAGFLSTKTGPRQPSPVKRGVAVLDRLMCIHLDPPGDVPPLEESTSGREPKTNREKYLIHEENPACQTCHVAIDGIGFTFENYDALGRWRDTDNGYPVDASGQLVGTDQDGEVNDWVELANKLGKSRKVHDCYTRQWFRFAFGRDETDADEPTLTALQEGFWKSGGDIPELLVNIAASHEFRHRRASK